MSNYKKLLTGPKAGRANRIDMQLKTNLRIIPNLTKNNETSVLVPRNPTDKLSFEKNQSFLSGLRNLKRQKIA